MYKYINWIYKLQDWYYTNPQIYPNRLYLTNSINTFCIMIMTWPSALMNK